MSENWSAVARAINERVNELGLRQRELAERSGVSQAIVRELQLHTIERRRSSRTLEALSVALDCHPGHLAAVLRGRRPLEIGETGDEGADRVAARLDAIEARLDMVVDQLEALAGQIARAVERKGEHDVR